jgi:hypothetical protein
MLLYISAVNRGSVSNIKIRGTPCFAITCAMSTATHCPAINVFFAGTIILESLSVKTNMESYISLLSIGVDKDKSTIKSIVTVLQRSSGMGNGDNISYLFVVKCLILAQESHT